MIKLVKKNIEFYIAQINLTSGSKLRNERLREVKDIMSILNVNENKNQFICGNFNEHLEEGTKLINLLKDHHFLIENEELERLNEYSCDKIRSAAQ